jgi:hypothetical protein
MLNVTVLLFQSSPKRVTTPVMLALFAFSSSAPRCATSSIRSYAWRRRREQKCARDEAGFFDSCLQGLRQRARGSMACAIVP